MGRVALPAQGVVYLDTSVFIYAVEHCQPYASLVAPIWPLAAAGRLRLATSELTAMEALVAPLRAGDVPLQDDYRRMLYQSDVKLQSVSTTVLMAASALRAAYPALRTPDAVHIATAQQVGCGTFLTNDHRLGRVPGLPVLLLDDLLSAA